LAERGGARSSGISITLSTHSPTFFDKDTGSVSKRLATSIGAVDQQDSTASLRALEGAGTAPYFEGFADLLPDPLKFSGRNRRPPRDPVNAMLSLGYGKPLDVPEATRGSMARREAGRQRPEVARVARLAMGRPARGLLPDIEGGGVHAVRRHVPPLADAVRAQVLARREGKAPGRAPPADAATGVGLALHGTGFEGGPDSRAIKAKNQETLC
jgi:hypothetical protein